MALETPRKRYGLIAGVAIMLSGFATAQVVPPGSIESQPLATDAFSTGVLNQADGALPDTLWRGADPRTIEFLLDNMPTRPAVPALGEVMRRTLLSPGAAPNSARPALGGKKLLALSNAGFVEEAATVASLSTAGPGDPWISRAEAVSDLLSDNVQGACSRSERLVDGRDDPFWVKLRVLCYAAADERDAADLSLGILRDRFGLSDGDDVFLTAAVTGAAPKDPPAATTPLQYAIAKFVGIPLSPGLLKEADGAVLATIAADEQGDPATRVAAAQRAVAMGVMPVARLRAIMGEFEFDVAALRDAAQTASVRAGDPLTDALLYQSAAAMGAPEFIRDKAKRISVALSLGDTFYRAYALSLVYADEIRSLEGVIVAPEEAGRFAAARMAAGDSVGAGSWLQTMIAPGASVGSLPQQQAMSFIELVNLLSVLDPQSAAQIARAADVSLLNGESVGAQSFGDAGDPVIAASVLEAAFDAALEEKVGQAGLAALAASNTGPTPASAVVVSQSLKAAGMADLQRRFQFERSWASRFPTAPDAAAEAPSDEAEEEDGFSPRLKPQADR